MLAALLTTVFFSFSAIFAGRSLRAVGQTRANLGRLLVALGCLGAYAHTLGGGLGGAGLAWFFWSGVIGMGLGDLASFAAIGLLGARLAVLMTQCLAVPIAMVAEWVWLGTTLTAAQVGWATVIVAGVAFALMPSRKHPPRVRVRPVGFIWGVLAAAGQGLGAVLTRKANDAAHLAGGAVDGITAAYQRMWGGLAITVVAFAVLAIVQRREPGRPATRPRPRAYGWIVANALCGAVIGVSCYQWALVTTPSGLVLPIVACTPLVIVPLAWWIEGERPTRRSLVGGVAAVAGVIALLRVR